MSSKVLTDTQKRLGIKIPNALRDYYLVAGNVNQFHNSHNQFLHPEDWEVDKQRLLFMMENQAVACWGVSLRNPDTDDPSISQGDNDEPIYWWSLRVPCSIFLARMLHMQAVCGGCRFTGSGEAPSDLSYSFEENGWTHFGDLNELHTYSRLNQVVCVQGMFLPWNKEPTVLVMAGTKTKKDFENLSAELRIQFD